MAPTMTVKIPRKGPIVVEMNGVKGQGCQEMTKFMTLGLGTTQETQLKSEFYEGGQEEHLHQSGGN